MGERGVSRLGSNNRGTMRVMIGRGGSAGGGGSTCTSRCGLTELDNLLGKFRGVGISHSQHILLCLHSPAVLCVGAHLWFCVCLWSITCLHTYRPPGPCLCCGLLLLKRAGAAAGVRGVPATLTGAWALQHSCLESRCPCGRWGPAVHACGAALQGVYVRRPCLLACGVVGKWWRQYAVNTAVTSHHTRNTVCVLFAGTPPKKLVVHICDQLLAGSEQTQMTHRAWVLWWLQLLCWLLPVS